MNASVADRMALLRKYNVPGPRYTSYPTVPYWERTPTEEQWIAALRAALIPSPPSTGGSTHCVERAATMAAPDVFAEHGLRSGKGVGVRGEQ